MKFNNLPNRSRLGTNQNKPVTDKPFVIKNLAVPTTKKHSTRNFYLKWGTIVIVLLAIFYFILYNISSWFDNHKLTFQQPVLVKVQSPILIGQRFVYSPIPKATYIDVNPLTKTSDVDVVVKSNGNFSDYIQTEALEPVSKDMVRTLVHNKVIQKWGESAWKEIDYILTNESGYDPYIVNKKSGACGIFQSLPCAKLPSFDVTDQINWGINYIENRYGTADNAFSFKKEKGWY
jgi:hypothetical protein